MSVSELSAPVVVLASGSGTLLRSLLEACRKADYPARVVAVVVDRPCAAIEHATRAGVPVHVQAPDEYTDRKAWDGALADTVAAYNPELVVSSGFMRLLGAGFLERFPRRVINTHPTLLPAFPGMHGVRDALAYGVRVTGATVHLVDTGVDTGPIVAQEPVPIRPDDTEESLHERIKVVERRMLVDTVATLITTDIDIAGRTVRPRVRPPSSATEKGLPARE